MNKSYIERKNYMNKIGNTFEELDLNTMNTVQGNGIGTVTTLTITISYCPIITPITAPVTVTTTITK